MGFTNFGKRWSLVALVASVLIAGDALGQRGERGGRGRGGGDGGDRGGGGRSASASRGGGERGGGPSRSAGRSGGGESRSMSRGPSGRSAPSVRSGSPSARGPSARGPSARGGGRSVRESARPSGRGAFETGQSARRSVQTGQPSRRSFDAGQSARRSLEARQPAGRSLDSARRGISRDTTPGRQQFQAAEPRSPRSLGSDAGRSARSQLGGGRREYQAARPTDNQVRNFLQMRQDGAARQSGDLGDRSLRRGDEGRRITGDAREGFRQGDRDRVGIGDLQRRDQRLGDAARRDGMFRRDGDEGRRGDITGRRGDADRREGRDRDESDFARRDRRDRDGDDDRDVSRRGRRDFADGDRRDFDGDRRDFSRRDFDRRGRDRSDIARQVRSRWRDRDWDDLPFHAGWWGGRDWRGGRRWDHWGRWSSSRPWYWWAWVTTPRLYGWFDYGWREPYYWDYGYGNYIYYDNGAIYVNGRWYQPAPVFYENTVRLVEEVPVLTPEEAAAMEWLPLGVFAVTPDGQVEAEVLVQLAVTQEGVIGGTAFDQQTGAAFPVEGTVEKETQRAVWGYTNDRNERLVMETSIFNLTQPEASGLVHYGPADIRVVELVRLEAPEGTAVVSGAELPGLP